MLTLGKILAWVCGPAAIPLLLASIFAMGGKLIISERAALRAEGETKCQNEWQLAVLQRERDTALALSKAAESQLEANDTLIKGLKDDAARIKGEFDSFVREATVSGDRFCVSQRVLDLARGVRSEERSVDSSKSAGDGSRPKAARSAK